MSRAVGNGADGEQPEAVLSDAELMERLRSRAADCLQNSMTARLGAVLDLVESLLGRGYGRSQVLEILIEVGWCFTPDSFDSALTRVRKRRQGGGTRATVTVQESNAEVGLPANVNSSSMQPPAQSNQVSPAAAASSGAEEKPQSGFSDVFFAQRRPDGGPRWK